MTFDIPDDRRYSETHEWAKPEGDTVTIGISDFAQDELGDIVYIELPDDGESITAGEPFGIIESIKAVNDLYAPISGTVVARNDELFDAPEQINEAPYEAGWMVRIEPDDQAELETLLSPSAYEERV